MEPSEARVENAWNPNTYDGRHSFVFEYGEDVVGLLDPQPGERILDLGCGTGHLTNRIAETGAEVVGIDRAPEMLEEAQRTYPERRFVRADARTLPFADAFDGVFSNAVLHWIAEQDAVVRSVAAALRPGGRFVVELGGSGNVGSIVEAVETELRERGYGVQNPWYFPSVGEYAAKLESHGFEVQYATLFDRPTELDEGAAGLSVWLDMFGDSLLSPLSDDEREAVVSAVEDELRDDHFDEDVWVADYRRLRVVAVLDHE